ncbi:baculoviral iap repeat-containing 5b [Vairimorpha apis BRL 01]|uniref:Baculoviral iap repeat-containing 5b n=1 Tax=Vairimorpha apis BRL 01 TaxID=1037528 RepID=T0MLE3_9MICR|nr:baculoviral iap repeat-containing 5b [Vairimorpha apis BRL 01]
MLSYEERLKTFTDKNWPNSEYKCTSKLMALCGFVCESTKKILVAKCIYCEKILEGWEKSDIPIIEHYNHKKKCVLFNPRFFKNRLLFFDSNDDKSLPKNNFIRYDIIKNRPFIFCYKCGSTTKHTCKDIKFKIDFIDSNIFFFKLISGKFLDMIDLHITTNLKVPVKIKNIFEGILEKVDPFCSLNEFLIKYEHEILDNLEIHLF